MPKTFVLYCLGQKIKEPFFNKLNILTLYVVIKYYYLLEIVFCTQVSKRPYENEVLKE